MRNAIVAWGFIFLAACVQTGHATDTTSAVRQLLAKENIRSGLCVHLGRTDGQVETALG